MSSLRHGTENCYVRHGCRCDLCRAAATAAAGARRRRDKPVPDEKHGTVSGYDYYRCRCERCTTAWRSHKHQYNKEYRERHRERLLVQARAYRARKRAQRIAEENARLGRSA